MPKFQEAPYIKDIQDVTTSLFAKKDNQGSQMRSVHPLKILGMFGVRVAKFRLAFFIVKWSTVALVRAANCVSGLSLSQETVDGQSLSYFRRRREMFRRMMLIPLS